jgi:hypothetical protein
MCKHNAPPLISLCILFFTVCIALLAGSMNTKDDMDIPAIAGNHDLMNEKNLNDAETLVLKVLDSAGEGIQSKKATDTKEYSTYKKELKKYLESNDVNLNNSIAQNTVNKIIQLNTIMDMENEFNINKMSLDGRELAIHLTQEIYELCGLKLSYNMQGDIITITDKAGKNTYFKNSSNQKADFQGEVFIGSVVLILLLIFLVFSIAKKNQLFVKDVKYDGIGEKGYA